MTNVLRNDLPAVKVIRFNGTSQWLLPNVYRVSAAQWRYRDFPSLSKGLPCPYLVSLHLSPAPGSHRQGEQLIRTVTPCVLAIGFFHSTQGRKGPSQTSGTQEAGVAGGGGGGTKARSRLAGIALHLRRVCGPALSMSPLLAEVHADRCPVPSACSRPLPASASATV